jgi:hypothetical protein
VSRFFKDQHEAPDVGAAGDERDDVYLAAADREQQR